jgi:hypothetical protein
MRIISDGIAEVLEIVKAYGEAIKAGDPDAWLAFHSRDWMDNHGAIWNSLKGYYQGMGNKGGYEKAQLDWQAAEIALDGDIAIVTPVTLSFPSGSITYTYKLRR